MLSYHADMDINTNPYELGLERLINLEIDADFIGKAALERISREGVSRRHVGLEIEEAPLTGPNSSFWPVFCGEKNIGKVTSAIHSPRLDRNIALAMVDTEFAEIGTKLEVRKPGARVVATVVEKPFYDPRKKLISAAA